MNCNTIHPISKAIEVSNGKTVVDLFIAQARIKSECIAVVYERNHINYRELDDQSTKLAINLRKNGIAEEVCVPVLLEHSVEIIVAILGIMKAGGAYVPIDPEYPNERIAYILQDTGAEVILTCKSLKDKISGIDLKTILIPDILVATETESEFESFSLPLPQQKNLAYVIYTSGSTGKPKGVMVEHGQLYNYTLDVQEEFNLHECNSFGLIGTFAADAGHTALFNSLCYGKRLSLFNIKRISRFESFIENFKKFPIDCYKVTPSLLQLFLKNKGVKEILPQMKLILGGESSSWTLANTVYKILPPGCRLYNHYGPTETTVGVITYSFPFTIDEFPKVIPLGKPLPNVQVYILNELFQQVSYREVGELYIQGPLVARGYLKNPDLTNQRFIHLKISGQPKRLYKTGDIVRSMQDGNIEYLGRVDDQVKINGNRIELKEIEQVILESFNVKECVVVAESEKSGAKYIVSYIIPNKEFNQCDIIAEMQRKLPSYMIPTKWVVLSKWPLTFNNKIDKNKLPDQVRKEYENSTIVTKIDDPVQAELIVLWRQVLGKKDVRVNENFFAVGGDSLKVIQLSFEISSKFQIELSAVELYKYATIEKLAMYLNRQTKSRPLNLSNLSEINEASVAQRNLFIQNKLNPSIAFPNSSITFQVNGILDYQKLEHALRKIISENESLITVYIFKSGKVYKQEVENFNFNIEYIQSTEIDINVEINKITKPFNFGKFPLIRAYVIELLNNSKFFHIDMPHINSDGETLKIIMDELEARYNGKYKEQKRIQFTDFQKYVYSYLQSYKVNEDKVFWTEELSTDLPSLKVDINNRSVASKYDGIYVVLPFSFDLKHKINDYAKNKNVTKFQFLLSVYFLLLYKITNTNDMVVMVPLHNRNDRDIQQVLGLLSNVVLLRANVNLDDTINHFINRCKEKILMTFYHQRFPFENQLELWKNRNRDIKRLINFFFGYHYNREIYNFESASLRLYIPRRDKENLPLSMALFETENDITLRLSSNLFNEAELNLYATMYSALINMIIENREMESLDSILNFSMERQSSSY